MSSRMEEIARLGVTLDLNSQSYTKQLSTVKKETRNLSKDFEVSKKAIADSEDKFDAYTKTLEKGQNAIQSLSKQLEVQVKRYDDLRDKTKGIDQEYQNLSKELDKQKSYLQELSKAENANNDEIKKTKETIDDLNKKLNEKQEVIQRNIDKLQRYSTDIDKTENSMKKLTNEVKDVESEFEKFNSGIDNTNLDELSGETSSFGDAIKGVDLGNFTELLDSAGVNTNLLTLGVKGAGLALAGMFVGSVISGAKEYDKSLVDLQIQLGKSKDQAKELQKEILEFSQDGYAIENITDATKSLSQKFKDLSKDDMKNLSQDMSILNDKGFEYNDVVRFMTSAVNNWGMTHEQALDMILSGEQQGLNLSGDWLDVLNEYSPMFSNVGLSGEDAFKLIKTQVENTSATSDQAADVIKEFFLKITEGSDATKGAISDMGLDFNELQNDINKGGDSSVLAFAKVQQAIIKNKDVTEQNRLEQELFGGTYEYFGTNASSAWDKVTNSVGITTGAMDNAKQAYEESYQAMQQKLDTQWEVLKETLGSYILPLLTEITKGAIFAIERIELVGQSTGILFNDFILQVVKALTDLGITGLNMITDMINIIPGGEKITEKFKPAFDTLTNAHKDAVDKIGQNQDRLNELSKEDTNLYNQLWGDSFEKTKNDASTKTSETANVIKNNMSSAKTGASKESSEMANNIQKDLESVAKKSGMSTQQAKDFATKNFNAMKSSANSELSGVKGAVGSNMDGSLKIVQVQATEMYKGVKTSFYKMNESARTDGTRMYLGVKQSAESMSRSAKSSASDMYRGVTTSTRLMANQAISDWNRIRSAYSRSIRGSITTTHTTINTVKNQTQSLDYEIDPTGIDGVDAFDGVSEFKDNMDSLDYGYSPVINSNTTSTDDSSKDIKEQNNLLKTIISLLSNDDKKIQNNLYLDGYQIAQAIAPYKKEIDDYDRRGSKFAY